MSSWLIFAVMLAYIGVAIDQVCKEDLPMALVWAGYALANVGFLFVVK